MKELCAVCGGENTHYGVHMTPEECGKAMMDRFGVGEGCSSPADHHKFVPGDVILTQEEWRRICSMNLDLKRLNMLRDAIDSHIYWQLSDQDHRNNGFVDEKGSCDEETQEEIQEFRALDKELEAECKRLGRAQFEGGA